MRAPLSLPPLAAFSNLYLPHNDREHVPMLGTTRRFAVFILFVKVFDLQAIQHRADLSLCVKGHIRFVCPRITHPKELTRESSARVKGNL